ncbi:hypothetical protein D3C72_2408510 [compost metagenome]
MITRGLRLLVRDRLKLGFLTRMPPWTSEPTPTVMSPLTVSMLPFKRVSTSPMPPLTVSRLPATTLPRSM